MWHDDDEIRRPDWYRMTTAEGSRLDWQIVGSRSTHGRLLLVVELGEDAEARVLDAIGVLVGREKPGHR